MLSTNDPTPEMIKEWVDSQRGKALIWSEWPERIWSKAYPDCDESYDGIVSYIYDRFRMTLDSVEYYSCMPFLSNDVDYDILYVPFRQSPQYQRRVLGLSKATASVKTPLLQKKKWKIPAMFKKYGR